jgi:NTE family protein
MEALNEGFCLVLSGGGAKGVYHIGVWKALKELGIGIDGFTGTSIGAIIAGFLAQGADDALEELGKSITIDSILELPDKFDTSLFETAPEFFQSLFEKRGFDTSPLRSILQSKVDEKSIRAGGKDLGIVTVNISDLRPEELFIDEMEEGTLIDYLMASAALPGFLQPTIEGKKYIDGGIYDNIPYGMARKRGYRRIIISDISGVGRNRKPEIEGSMTVYIKNSIEMGGILDFDRIFLDRFTLLGYLDTLRTFGILVGYSYFLEPNDKAESRFQKEASEIEKVEAKGNPAFPPQMVYDGRKLLKYLECTASILEVERICRYTYEEFLLEIRRVKDQEENKIQEHLNAGDETIAGIISTLRSAISDKNFERCPYYYWRMAEELLPKSAGKVLRKALFRIFPELSAGMGFLKTFESWNFIKDDIGDRG